MKYLLYLLALTLLFHSCATTNKMTDEAFHYAIVGQNEKTLYYRVGKPTSITSTSDGGKVMIYEYYSKGIYSTPYKSKITYNPEINKIGEREGITFNSGTNTATNDPKFTIYDQNISYLKLYLDKQGYCVRFEQNLPKEQLDMYYEQFKRYIPKD